MIASPALENPAVLPESPVVKYTDRPRPKVFLPIPAYDWKTEVHFQAAVLQALGGCHAELTLHWGLGDGIARTRNNLAWHFLTQTQCEFIFFVDSDIPFEPVQLDRIVSHNLPICGGLYPKKQGVLSWVVSSLAGETPALDSHLLKVREAGTGFLCIRRDVLESMVKKYPEIAYRGDPSPDAQRWDFFPMHAHEGRYLSEDWFFCNRARECGYDVVVDTSVQLRHVGKIVFPLQKTLTDEEVIDLLHYRCAHSVPEITAFLGADLVRNLADTPDATLWPEEFLQAGIAPDHCSDVLAGCYNVPLVAKVGEPLTVLDIGANIGAFLRFATARWPGCTVHCYEPHPGNYALLEKTAAAIGPICPIRPILHPVGVSDHAGQIALHLGRDNCGEHSIKDIGEQTSASVPVELIDAANLPHADILKIDTEGCEVEILGKLEAFGRLAEFAAIMLEYHSEPDRGRIYTLLSATHTLLGVHSRCPDRGEMRFVRSDLLPKKEV